MASRDDRGDYDKEPTERSDASAAPTDSGGPMFDPLFAPLPSELAGEPGLKGPGARPRKDNQRADAEARRRAPRARTTREVQDEIVGDPWDETQLLPPRRRAEPEGRPRRATTPTPTPRRARGPMRKIKRTITHVDPMTVLKLSLFYYAIFFVVWLIFMAIAYNLIAATGVFDAIQTITDVFGSDGSAVEINFGFVMRWAALLGVIAVVLGSIVNFVLAVLYNVGSDVVGGVSVTFTERDE